MLGHAKVSVCVFDGELAPVVGRLETTAKLISTDSVADGFDFFDDAITRQDGVDGIDIDENDPAEILYTSGTTGSPKGCVHSHRNVVGVAVTAALAVSTTRDERLLMAVPIWHASPPLNNWFMSTLYMGGTVVLLREYHPSNFWKQFRNNALPSASARRSSIPPHSTSCRTLPTTTSEAFVRGCTAGDRSARMSLGDWWSRTAPPNSGRSTA